MPAFITLDGLTWRTPDGRPLFEDLTLSFGAERTGLVGRNGVGKTTLLRLITGELTPAAGACVVAGRLAVLRQAHSPPPGASLAELLGAGEGLARLARLAAGEGSADDLAEADWDLEPRLDAALAAVGLGDVPLDRRAEALSGGQATRAVLAGVLAAQPDVLILDEPTNNLDAAGRAAVAQVLESWNRGAIVVSHDRGLLRRMDRIVELTSLGARVYGGGYDLYGARKAEEDAASARALSDAERAAARTAREAQVALERKARRDAAGRRARARGDAPKILLDAQAERVEASGGRGARLAERQRAAAQADLNEAQGRMERLRALAIELPPTGLAAGKTVLALDDVGFAWPGGPALFSGVVLRITGPERVALSGANGAGKSTLIRLVAGELAPSAGRVALGVPAALLDQQCAKLHDGETLLEAFRRLNPASDDNAAHAALARFLFRNTAAARRVGDLSGGERLRAALACVLMTARPPQFLVLDEPTNHLDLDSIAAVEAALRGYDGALLIASHDKDFLEAVGVERTIFL